MNSAITGARDWVANAHLKIKAFLLLPSLRKQRAGCRHHEDQTVKTKDTDKMSGFFPSVVEPLEIRSAQSPSAAPLSTYNTPTSITWIGPCRYVILCMNLYFSSLCMMMGRMTDQGREGEERGRAEGEVSVAKGPFEWCSLVFTHSFLVQPW